MRHIHEFRKSTDNPGRPCHVFRGRGFEQSRRLTAMSDLLASSLTINEVLMRISEHCVWDPKNGVSLRQPLPSLPSTVSVSSRLRGSILRVKQDPATVKLALNSPSLHVVCENYVLSSAHSPKKSSPLWQMQLLSWNIFTG